MAYSWKKQGGLMPAQLVSSPVVQPLPADLVALAEHAAWTRERTHPQRSDAAVEHALQRSSPGACTTRLPGVTDVRCVACGGSCGAEGAWAAVTRTEEYEAPERRLLYLYGPFCRRSCRLGYLLDRWWTFPGAALTPTTLLDLVAHGEPPPGAGPAAAPAGVLPYRTRWEEVELFYQDVAQGVDAYELPADLVARWSFRDRWRALPPAPGQAGVCANCLQTYGWGRFRLPTEQDRETGDFRFHPELEFCDPSCWKRFVLSSRAWDTPTHLALGAVFCATKLRLPRVLAAPPREAHVDWMPVGGLDTVAFREAAYAYRVVEFMPAPFVGTQMRLTRDPCLYARDVVDALAAAWPVDEDEARTIADRVASAGGSEPRLPLAPAAAPAAPQALRAFLPFRQP